MPNYVKNILTITGIPGAKEENYILNKLAYLDTDDVWKIDFNKIIPEPKFKQDCPKEYRITRKLPIELCEGKPWYNWYDWRIANWGTKWEARKCNTNVIHAKSNPSHGSSIVFTFNTAWNCPKKIIQEICKLGYPLEVQYADEDLGINCGIMTYDPSTKKLTDTPNEDQDYARAIWEK